MKNKSGIKIKTDQYSLPAKTEHYGYFISMLLSAGIIITLCESFTSLYSGMGIYIAISAVLSAVILYVLNSKVKKYAAYGIFAVLAGYAAVFFKAVKNGIILMGNDYLSFLTTIDGKIHLDYAYDQNLPAVYVGILLCMIVSVLCALSVKRREFISLSGLGILLFAGLVVGFVPTGAGFGLLLLGMLLHMGYCRIGKGGSVNLKSAFMSVCIVILCFLIALGTMIFPEEWFAESMSEMAEINAHDKTYHSSTPSMPEGNLENLGFFDKNPTAAVRISMEKPQKMYLKGMTGEVYTGTNWESLDFADLSEYEDTFYWLHKYGYFSQSSISDAMRLTDENTEEFLMQLTLINACSENVPVPYALASDNLTDKDIIGDSKVYAAEGQKSYTYSYFAGSVPEWYLTQNSLAGMQAEEKVNEYLTYEETYRDFVYKNYLQLTNAAIGSLDRLLGTEKKGRTLAEIRKNIFDTLEETLTYDEGAVTKNAGNDFFKFVMEQTKKGYSVHYATAAVLMLRYYGVPARYVEGYFLSKAEAEEYEPSETIILDESHAHAWAEYYLDGIGWIPFEVTPGYVDDEELKLSSDEISNQQIYESNKLKYTPPIQQEERQPLSNWRDLFAIKKEHILSVVALIILYVIIRAFILRRRLRKSLKNAQEMDNKELIKTLYGYAQMLLSKLEERYSDEEIRLINREAMFSDHEMTDEQAQKVREYLKKVEDICKKEWKIIKKIKYRFIECIYL